MLGKASELKFHSVDSFFGTYVSHETVSTKLNNWKAENPNAIVIEVQYKTYACTDADGNVGWGESALIIYKEDQPSVYEERGMLSL